ncbi:adenylyl-sulfate kinase [Ralstonia insidiosa]
MTASGVHVVVALVSPYRQDRREAHRIIGSTFFEVFVDADRVSRSVNFWH